MNLGEKISSLRKQKNMTQFDLAEKLHVSNKMVSKWETNRSLPDVETIKRIADEFGITINELFGCIHDNDIEDKAYDFNIIYKFKKYCYISIGLVIVAGFFTFLFSNASVYLRDPIPIESHGIFYAICVICTFLSLLVSVIMFITQAIYMKEVCKKNPLVTEYRNVFKRYSIIFGVMICVAILSIIIYFSIYLYNAYNPTYH